MNALTVNHRFGVKSRLPVLVAISRHRITFVWPTNRPQNFLHQRDSAGKADLAPCPQTCKIARCLAGGFQEWSSED